MVFAIGFPMQKAQANEIHPNDANIPSVLTANETLMGANDGWIKNQDATYIIEIATNAAFTTGNRIVQPNTTQEKLSPGTYFIRWAAFGSFGAGTQVLIRTILPGTPLISGGEYIIYKDTDLSTPLGTRTFLANAVDLCGTDGAYTIIATMDDNNVSPSHITIPVNKTITLKSENIGELRTIIQPNMSRHFNVQGNLILENIVVEGISATISSGYAGGISVGNSAILTMKNHSAIQYCTAWSGGGGVQIGSGGTLNMIDNSIIAYNKAGNSAGVNVGGTLNMSGSATIKGNEANNGAGVGNFSGVVNMEGESSICGNVASNYGGGIRNANGDGIINIWGSASVCHNEASLSGGGIYNVGTLNVEGSATIINNEVYNDSQDVAIGGGVNNYGTANIKNAASISGNRAFFGGGVYNANGILNMFDYSLISGNEAYERGEGGGVNSTGYGEVNMYDYATISENTAGRGGGLTNSGWSIVTMKDYSKMVGNLASVGGGIHNGSVIKLKDNVRVSNNYASSGGGGIINYYQLLMQDNSTISNNKASEGGGALNFQAATFKMQGNSTIRENEAEDGGAIWNYGDFIMRDYSSISGNKATNDGGGIYNYYHNALKITGYASLIDNEAFKDGGAIYAGLLEYVEASSGVTFAGNTADNDAYYMIDEDDIALHDEKIQVPHFNFSNGMQYAYNNLDISYTKGLQEPLPTQIPTNEPTLEPTISPTNEPTIEPTNIPTQAPTQIPTQTPTQIPTEPPTAEPTSAPTPVSPFITDDHFDYIKGYEDGGFRPGNSMTRAEVAVMFTRIIKEEIPNSYAFSNKFSDVKAGDWFAKEVEFLASLEIIAGYAEAGGGKYFEPYGQITRAEFATICSRFFDLETNNDIKFGDVPGNHWAYDGINGMAAKGWIIGYSEAGGGKYFLPNGDITRAEVVTIINRMLGRVYGNVDKLKMKIPFDVPANFWAYHDILEAMNAHEFEIRDGKEVWTKVR